MALPQHQRKAHPRRQLHKHLRHFQASLGASQLVSLRPPRRRPRQHGRAPSGLRTAAFKNEDGSIAVIAISSSGSAINVNVKITGASELGTATVEAYVSDNNRNCEKVAGAASISADGTITGTVASRSVTTFFVPGQWTS